MSNTKTTIIGILTMLNNKKTSKRIVVLVKKIKTLDVLDEKLAMVEDGFMNLSTERTELQNSLNTEQEERIRMQLVDKDREKAREQTRLVNLKDQLNEHREEIIKDRKADVDGYEPEVVEW